ncbi:MAG: UvrB/UvrC motif-containing protein, partial [Bacteroidetes bacterium]|nr:UvrB/UvrC motif-containing protein [Bacteroidota bacterium]
EVNIYSNVSFWEHASYTLFDEYCRMHEKNSGRITRAESTWVMQREWLKEGDAILAVATLENKPVGFSYIFTYKNILDKAGIFLKANPIDSENDNQEIDDILSNPGTFGLENTDDQPGRPYMKNSLDELNELLTQAVENEDYEKAAKVRDEISKRES